jgi:hypothetical protein
LTAIYFSFAFLTDAQTSAQKDETAPDLTLSPDLSNVVPLGSSERQKFG